ncbi:hypothetical protein WDW89_00900 [Deltaproteobacteria bacterium TL4]
MSAQDQGEHTGSPLQIVTENRTNPNFHHPRVPLTGTVILADHGFCAFVDYWKLLL